MRPWVWVRSNERGRLQSTAGPSSDGSSSIASWRTSPWIHRRRISPICKLTRKAGVKVVHLGAPQLWAWGSWRAAKLRKLSDLVLCLLPHEPMWFQQRKIKSRFIGHPAINRELDLKELKNMLHGMPHGAPRLCLFPGSRPQEVRRNLRLLVPIVRRAQVAPQWADWSDRCSGRFNGLHYSQQAQELPRRVAHGDGSARHRHRLV